jgi:hypothetical protein
MLSKKRTKGWITKMSANFHRSTRCHITEHRTLRNRYSSTQFTEGLQYQVQSVQYFGVGINWWRCMTNLTNEYSFHEIHVHSPYDWSCRNKLRSHWLVETVLRQTHSILLELVHQAHPHCLLHPPVLESVSHLHPLTVNRYKRNSPMKKELRKNKRSWVSEQMLPSVCTFNQGLKFLYNDKTIHQ